MNEESIGYYQTVMPSGFVEPSGTLTSASGTFVKEYRYDMKVEVYDKQMKTRWIEDTVAISANEEEAQMMCLFCVAKLWEPRYYKATVKEIKKVENV